MPRGRKSMKESEVVIKKEPIVATDSSCQTEEWTEDRMIKYRKMKRKLMEFNAKKTEYQAALDKANRRIQTLEKKNRQYLQQQKRATIKKSDEMDISPNEEEIDELNGALDEDEEEEEEEEEEDQLDEDNEVSTPKKQRLSRRKRVMVPRDENGNINLPFQIASLNVLDLGTIEPKRSQFHNERYIFPIGYTVERTYMSMVDPNNQTTYTCKVEDGEDAPLFTLSAADAPEIELSARTATGVWALVIKKANEVRQKESSNAISGPEYYGFAHPLVIEMIEEMDGVDECFRYKRRHKQL